MTYKLVVDKVNRECVMECVRDQQQQYLRLDKLNQTKAVVSLTVMARNCRLFSFVSITVIVI